MSDPTLSIKVGFPVEMPKSWHVISAPAESNLIHRRKVGAWSPRKWIVIVPVAESTEVTSVQSLFDQVKGRGGRFLWQPPGESTPVRCMFMNDQLERRSLSPGHEEIRLEIQEVRI